MTALRRRQRVKKVGADSQSQRRESNPSAQAEDASAIVDTPAPESSSQHNVPPPDRQEKSFKLTPSSPETNSAERNTMASKNDSGLRPPSSAQHLRRSPRLRNSPRRLSGPRGQEHRIQDDANTATTLKTFNTIKEEQIMQLKLELVERREALRKNYTAAAKSLRARLEMRIHRIPRHLRHMTLGELRNMQLSNSRSSPRREVPVA
ncbi:hypothetical protein V1525DRAFT_404524 [Lipomyces kononenkoae]|uniref:Uncharacterized protein n=1 Tax=Lipomyces kononenkoae TaxID=34357 RepID=A0ACC3T0I7_LIPKO